MLESSEINSDTLAVKSNSTVFDQSNIIVKILEDTLLDFIKKIIVDEELKKKYTIVLNDEVLDIINKILLKTPNTFNDIEKSIKEGIKIVARNLIASGTPVNVISEFTGLSKEEIADLLK